MSRRVCTHCLVRGRVQGVWYRASTKDQADTLGLSGWVRNLPGGAVEVLACGPETEIRNLTRWLQRGPPMALVETVQCRPAADETGLNGFEVR